MLRVRGLFSNFLVVTHTRFYRFTTITGGTSIKDTLNSGNSAYDIEVGKYFYSPLKKVDVKKD